MRPQLDLNDSSVSMFERVLHCLLMAIMLLGEPFTGWVAVGTVLVIAGIWLLARQPQSKKVF